MIDTIHPDFIEKSLLQPEWQYKDCVWEVGKALVIVQQCINSVLSYHDTEKCEYTVNELMKRPLAENYIGIISKLLSSGIIPEKTSDLQPSHNQCLTGVHLQFIEYIKQHCLGTKAINTQRASLIKALLGKASHTPISIEVINSIHIAYTLLEACLNKKQAIFKTDTNSVLYDLSEGSFPHLFMAFQMELMQFIKEASLNNQLIETQIISTQSRAQSSPTKEIAGKTNYNTLEKVFSPEHEVYEPWGIGKCIEDCLLGIENCINNPESILTTNSIIDYLSLFSDNCKTYKGILLHLIGQNMLPHHLSDLNQQHIVTLKAIAREYVSTITPSVIISKFEEVSQIENTKLIALCHIVKSCLNNENQNSLHSSKIKILGYSLLESLSKKKRINMNLHENENLTNSNEDISGLPHYLNIHTNEYTFFLDLSEEMHQDMLGTFLDVAVKGIQSGENIKIVVN